LCTKLIAEPDTYAGSRWIYFVKTSARRKKNKPTIYTNQYKVFFIHKLRERVIILIIWK